MAALPARVAALGREIGEASLVCIFDQNMNYPDGDVLGTDLCRELRADGWRGVPHPIGERPGRRRRVYREAGADGTLGKSVSSVADTVALPRGAAPRAHTVRVTVVLSILSAGCIRIFTSSSSCPISCVWFAPHSACCYVAYEIAKPSIHHS